MGYGKFELRCIELGLCVGCGDLAMGKGRRRCTPCAVKLAKRERARYRAAHGPKRRTKVEQIQRQRRLIEEGRLSYVTVKRRANG